MIKRTPNTPLSALVGADEKNRRQLSDFLKRRGYDVTAVSSFPAFKKLFFSGDFKIAISDAFLKQGSVFDLLPLSEEDEKKVPRLGVFSERFKKSVKLRLSGTSFYPLAFPVSVDVFNAFENPAVSKPLGASELAGAIERYLRDFFAKDPAASAVSGLHPSLIKEVEKALFSVTLEYTKGSQSKAASVLGLNRNTLHKKIKEYGLLSGLKDRRKSKGKRKE